MNLSMSRRDLVLLVLSGVLTLVYVAVAGGNFPLDDSWIHQTYARNLATRGEWAFVPGEPSAASTSPLYTLLLAAGYMLRVPFRLWTHLLGAAALAVSAIVGAGLAERYTGSARVGWAAGLALVSTWHLIWAAASGMETMLISMWTLILVALSWREKSLTSHDTSSLMRRGALFGLCVGLAALTRPEAVLLGGIAAALMLIVRPQGRFMPVIVWGIGAAVAFAVVLAPYLWLNWSLTGGVLPNTAAAKFQQHAHLLDKPLYWRAGALTLQIIAGGQVLLLPGVLMFGIQALRRKHKLAALYDLLPLFWSLALVLLYALRLPAAYQHGRYVIPALPALILLGVIGTWQLLALRQSAWIRIASRVLVLASALLFLWFAVWGIEIYRVDVAIIDGEMLKAAHWIRDNLPPDELLAVHDIGAVGYFALRPILDIAGLVDADVIEHVGDGEALWQLMAERNAQYLMAFPDQIPGRDAADKRLCEIYSTDTQITRQVGQANMKVYGIAYDATCDV